MSYENGYIKIPRDMRKLSVWENPWDVTLWLYCALRVSHCQYRFIKAGQFYSSKTQIAQDLKWSRNSLKEHLKSLQEKGYIEVESSYRGVCVTLKNWRVIAGEYDPDDYLYDDLDCLDDDQEWSNDESDWYQPDQPDGQIPTVVGHSTTPNGQHTTGICSPSDHKQTQKQAQNKTLSPRERDFDRWWQQYPRHANKADARRAYMAMDVSAETLLAALENAKQSRQWLQSNGRYIPNAAKWLDGAWMDYAQEQTVDAKREEKSEWTTY